jgi:type I restriction enzyme M protein
MSRLEQQLWASADILRGKMDASEYKNYLLGLVFYKYLSDLELRAAYEEDQGEVDTYPSREAQLEVLNDWYQDDADGLEEVLSTKIGFFIEPANLFYTLRQAAANYEFQISDLQNAFTELSKQGEQFSGLFDDVDLGSNKLGSSAQQKNVTITEVIKALDEIDLFGHDGDVIGDAYEYLIGQFAAGAGKKAGEFYTPRFVVKLMVKLLAPQAGETVYDPPVALAVC